MMRYHAAVSRSRLAVVGIVIFLVGGAILTFGPEPLATSLGTAIGIAGLLLAGWAWWARSKE
jgi:hypothetical protein